MASHHILGRKGEEIAVKFLQEKGYNILHTNWKHGRKEIDIIARYKGTLVFTEVKTRSGQAFGMPEEAVNGIKEAHIRYVAENYLERFQPKIEALRFDIVSITFIAGNPMEIIHLEDVF
jgi:putative endonuclease